MFDAYERDMIDALTSGKGPGIGADRQYLRRMVSERGHCQEHEEPLVLEQAVAVEIRGEETGRVWCLVLCADAFAQPHRQQALQAAIASPALTVTVYDGRQLFGDAPSATPSDAARERA